MIHWIHRIYAPSRTRRNSIYPPNKFKTKLRRTAFNRAARRIHPIRLRSKFVRVKSDGRVTQRISDAHQHHNSAQPPDRLYRFYTVARIRFARARALATDDPWAQMRTRCATSHRTKGDPAQHTCDNTTLHGTQKAHQTTHTRAGALLPRAARRSNRRPRRALRHVAVTRHDDDDTRIIVNAHTYTPTHTHAHSAILAYTSHGRRARRRPARFVCMCVCVRSGLVVDGYRASSSTVRVGLTEEWWRPSRGEICAIRQR